MATADQVISLVKSHFGKDNEKFKTTTLQIAAHEARLGHLAIANELKDYAMNPTLPAGKSDNPMLNLMESHHRLDELVVSDNLRESINRILYEYQKRETLHNVGLSNRRKILLEGDPGTGKTFTASVIATELNLPLYTVQLDKLVTRFMGETSVKLHQVFDTIENTLGVYLFDEFDAIGASRSYDNEVGEMRRVLNSFLQFLEQDNSQSFIIAATNNVKLLDLALLRRFDDVLHYTKPSEEEIKRLFTRKLSMVDPSFVIPDCLLALSKGLSQAEIIQVCNDAVKASLLRGQNISEKMLRDLILERKAAYLVEDEKTAKE